MIDVAGKWEKHKRSQGPVEHQFHHETLANFNYHVSRSRASIHNILQQVNHLCSKSKQLPGITDI
jgi:hypothetical protein